MLPARPLKVSICHSEPIINAGLTALLAAQPNIELYPGRPGHASWADVVVTDYSDGLARMQGFPECRERVMIVTRREREWDVRTAMAAGIHGYLTQHCSSHELLAALHALRDGQRYFNKELQARATGHALHCSFTPRENQVLELLALGSSNKQIARQLEIGVGTVKSHIKSLFGKLGATTRTNAVVRATQRGIVAFTEAA